MSYDINTSAIQLGTCKIWYWDESGWVAVGATSGGTRISYTPSYFNIKVDQTGETVVKKVLQGEDASLEFGIAENGLEKLQLAIPFGTIYTSSGDKAFGVGVNAGGDLLEHTIKLKVHPINTRGTGGSDDETYIDDDFTIWKAGNGQAVEIPFSTDAARVYRVTMTLFPDFGQGTGRYLFVIGDTSIAGDATSPDVNGVYPANAASDVAVSIEPVIVMDEELRELSDGVPNAIVRLVKGSDHSTVTASVSCEETVEGTADSGTATTLVDASLVSQDDVFNGLYIEIYGGTGAGDDLVAITDYTGSTGTVTVASWPNGTPDSTSQYRIHATQITLSPAASLDASTEYHVLVAAAKDVAGNVQTNIFESEFTTAA